MFNWSVATSVVLMCHLIQDSLIGAYDELARSCFFNITLNCSVNADFATFFFSFKKGEKLKKKKFILNLHDFCLVLFFS